MNDLDQLIVRTLTESADDGPINTDRLLAEAVVRGRRRRRRRRIAAGVAAGLVAVLGAGATIRASTAPTMDLSWPGGGHTAAVPPRATDTPGAVHRPDLVGSDPDLLHFGLDGTKARYLAWRSEPGAESIWLSAGDGPEVVVTLAGSPADMDTAILPDGLPSQPEPATTDGFDGRVRRVGRGDGGAPVWIMRWRPASGLFAQAITVLGDATDLSVAVAALRLDAAYRCSGPLRLNRLPAGALVSACTVRVHNYPAALQASIDVRRPDDKRMEVRLEYARSIDANRTEGNRMIGGRAAYLYPRGGQLELLGFPKAHLIAMFGWPYQGFDSDDAATALDGARVARDLARPDTWR